jgi:hypothetical protein
MKNLIYKSILGGFLLGNMLPQTNFAQEKTASDKKSKVIIRTNKNGQTEQFEWSSLEKMTPEMKQRLEALKEKLRAEGINLNLEDKNGVVFFSDGKTNPNAMKKSIKIFRDVNGEKQVIEEEFEGDKLPEDLKKRLDEIDVNTIEKIEINKEKLGLDNQERNAWIEKGQDNTASSSKHREAKVMIFKELDGNKMNLEADEINVFRVKIDDQEAKDLILKWDENSNGETKEFTTADGKKVKIIVRKLAVLKEVKSDENAAQSAKTEEPLADNKVQNLLLYPNPSGGRFNLKFDLPDQGDAQIGIYDMQGNKVYTEEVKNTRQYDKPVDLSTQKAGVYILRIAQNGKVYTRQIQVN